MKRDIVFINEELCDGCGVCIPTCHEGALQIIDGKARLVSDLMCDGLGACLGNCPQNAITIEKREAEPYDEIKVIKEIALKGENTIIAHLKHLKEHNELTYLKQAVAELSKNAELYNIDMSRIKKEVHRSGRKSDGCCGSTPVSFSLPKNLSVAEPNASALQQWPVQMHLINPSAPAFQKADLLIAADCVAYTIANFHSQHLSGKALAIACPKLDGGQQVYLDKLIQLIDNAHVNTITVMIMEVPCCGGLMRLVKQACNEAHRKVPVKLQMVSIKGEILKDEWM